MRPNQRTRTRYLLSSPMPGIHAATVDLWFSAGASVASTRFPHQCRSRAYCACASWWRSSLQRSCFAPLYPYPTVSRMAQTGRRPPARYRGAQATAGARPRPKSLCQHMGATRQHDDCPICASQDRSSWSGRRGCTALPWPRGAPGGCPVYTYGAPGAYTAAGCRPSWLQRNMV
ncbi:hypothetical protein BKA62DRAFT_482876 [Auriculariales sp. MPI-PUGE-AT-0066]|nr:hypothetical protein BKA62DRAFT_482876 [Auriculariales sp. MPI-PUGE-AT-0066]